MRRAPAAPDAGGALRSGAAALRRRLADERGFTLSELIVVMAILGIVLVALTTLFVSATNAQVDLSNRVDAQQNARLALDKLRREIHCAKTVTAIDGTPLTGAPVAGIRINLGTYCPTGSGDITWCTRAGSPGAYALYRIASASATCVGGTRWADYLVITNGEVFSYTPPATGHLHTLGVKLPVDLTPSAPSQRYTLQDDIVLRNSVRAT